MPKPWSSLSPQEEIRIEVTVAAALKQTGQFQEQRTGWEALGGTYYYNETVTREFQIWRFANPRFVSVTLSTKQIVERQRRKDEAANLEKLVSAAWQLSGPTVKELLRPVNPGGQIKTIGAQAAVAALSAGAHYADQMDQQVEQLRADERRLRKQLSEIQDPKPAQGGSTGNPADDLRGGVRQGQEAMDQWMRNSERRRQLLFEISDVQGRISDKQKNRDFGFKVARQIVEFCISKGADTTVRKPSLPEQSPRLRSIWARNADFVSLLDLALEIGDDSLLEDLVKSTSDPKSYSRVFGSSFGSRLLAIIGSDETRDTTERSKRLRRILKLANSRGL